MALLVRTLRSTAGRPSGGLEPSSQVRQCCTQDLALLAARGVAGAAKQLAGSQGAAARLDGGDPDHYAVLGVRQDAPLGDIRAAYRCGCLIRLGCLDWQLARPRDKDVGVSWPLCMRAAAVARRFRAVLGLHAGALIQLRTVLTCNIPVLLARVRWI